MSLPNATETTPARFRVADMTCGHCVGTVRQAIEARLPGARVSIDLATHMVETSGNAAAAEAAITEAGYTPERL